MKRIWNVLAELFFPPSCVGCGTLLNWRCDGESRVIFCDTCLQKWENERLDTCGICGRRVTECACPTEWMEQAKCKTFRKLVRAGSSSSGAIVSEKAVDYIVGFPSFEDFRNCLKVSGAAAEENDVGNNSVFVHIKTDFFGAGSGGFIIVMHFYFSFAVDFL